MRRRNLVKCLLILFVALTLLLPANTFAADQMESGGLKAAGEVCTTEAGAAEVMRAYLVKRVEEFYIPVRLKMNPASGTGDREKDLEKAMDRIRDLAFAETDKPYEGDYLNQVKGYERESGGYWDGDYFVGSLHYFCPLMSTEAQEKAVNAVVGKIMKELALDGKSEYQKIRAIYDYICSHSTYDENIDSDTPHTAYAILVKGKGVCEGYARAVYRLMREAGIGCRCIFTNNTKGNDLAGHAWNIVRIGKLWYYVDATWDTDYYKAKLPYQYFLKGSKDRSYVEHEEFKMIFFYGETDFWENHPLSPTDYIYKDPAPVEPLAPEKKEDPVVSGNNPAPAGTSASVKKNDLGGFNRRIPPQKLKVKAGKKRRAVLTWKKTPGASGYQIRYSVRKNMKSSKKVTIKKGSTLKKVIKHLKKKKYYFQIRAFRVLKDHTLYSVWSPKVARKIR